MSSLTTESARTWQREAWTDTGPADEYVEFWRAGALARGVFSCVACGRSVDSVHQLPPCPSCGAQFWEESSTSPFGGSGSFGDGGPPLAAYADAYERWREEDLARAAGVTRSVCLALIVGTASWLSIACLGYGILEAIHR